MENFIKIHMRTNFKTCSQFLYLVVKLIRFTAEQTTKRFNNVWGC